MKKARTVEIPLDRPLTMKEYLDLSEHAYNSLLWYVSTYSRNSQQVKDKLYRKGYIEEEVLVKKQDGETFTVNLVEEAIQRLIEAEVLSDRDYAHSFLQSKVNSGISLNRAKQELSRKGVSIDLIEDVILDFEDEEDKNLEAFEKSFKKLINNSSILSMEKEKRKQKILRSLVSKGFSFDICIEAINNFEDGLEEEERWMI